MRNSVSKASKYSVQVASKVHSGKRDLSEQRIPERDVDEIGADAAEKEHLMDVPQPNSRCSG